MSPKTRKALDHLSRAAKYTDDQYRRVQTRESCVQRAPHRVAFVEIAPDVERERLSLLGVHLLLGLDPLDLKTRDHLFE